MNMNVAINLYEDLMNGPISEKTIDVTDALLPICDECNNCMIHDDYFYVCEHCGTIDFEKTCCDIVEYTPKTIMYSRRQYWKKKLLLVSCLKQPRSKKYSKVLLDYEADDFDNINELRSLIYQNGHQKYYNNIYNIYYDIKKIKLINISYHQIDMLIKQFVEFESEWKNNLIYDGKNKKKINLPSYNGIIYELFRKNKIKGIEHLLLPLNHSTIIKKIRNYFI